MDRGPKGPRDDFFCWKFRVWYNMQDCVFRHHFRTHEECASCSQGRANAKLIGPPKSRPRWAALPVAVPDDAICGTVFEDED